MLHLVLADCELERVPLEIADHKVVRWWARRRGRKPTELLLDSSLFHPAMKKLKDGFRRGRPDIVHRCLLLSLDSPLNREGLLKVYVHTRNNEIIHVDPSTRLPRSFHRFVGLMEELFLRGETEGGLMKLERGSLRELIQRIGARTLLLDPEGEPKLWKELYGEEEEVCAVVGGFPEGGYLSDLSELPLERVCVDPEPLPSSTIVARLIFSYEEKRGIQERRLGRK
ncbi:MAG: 16S rRNA methyltransferase [Hadesarchaea archaeon]|nr:MAG: 16S rRNA methyltransferase [Hadesarchaea archaeon]